MRSKPTHFRYKKDRAENVSGRSKKNSTLRAKNDDEVVPAALCTDTCEAFVHERIEPVRDDTARVDAVRCCLGLDQGPQIDGGTFLRAADHAIAPVLSQLLNDGHIPLIVKMLIGDAEGEYPVYISHVAEALSTLRKGLCHNALPRCAELQSLQRTPAAVQHRNG